MKQTWSCVCISFIIYYSINSRADCRKNVRIWRQSAKIYDSTCIKNRWKITLFLHSRCLQLLIVWQNIRNSYFEILSITKKLLFTYNQKKESKTRNKFQKLFKILINDSNQSWKLNENSTMIYDVWMYKIWEIKNLHENEIKNMIKSHEKRKTI